MSLKFRTIVYLFSITALITSCCSSDSNEDLTGKYFASLKKSGDNAKLTYFFTQMPKGGDLHHHYSGAIYAETYLDWVAANKYFIDSKTLKFSTRDTMETYITAEKVRANSGLYRRLLEEWSDMDFSNNFHLQDPPDAHFFNTFSYFGNISKLDYHAGLVDIKEEAIKENVQYIETMLSVPRDTFKFSTKQDRASKDSLLEDCLVKHDTVALYHLLDEISKTLISDESYDRSIKNYLQEIYSYHKEIDDSVFTMRFQVYAVRKLPPSGVFATLYACFDASARDKDSILVGVNIVAPENDIVSMRDYWLHMYMFRYLHKKFPAVKIDMHAGELALGMVKPQDLTYHIHDAVCIAHAKRIGHGVDIPYETGAPKLLERMKKDSIAVEINLTSNEFILGVKGNDHPINLYYSEGVPIVISTDDAGVSRNNLTSQYVLLASRYNFSYKDIKTFVYNSIRYSFLKDNKKAALTKKLNQRFAKFEDWIAQHYGDSK